MPPLWRQNKLRDFCGERKIHVHLFFDITQIMSTGVNLWISIFALATTKKQFGSVNFEFQVFVDGTSYHRPCFKCSHGGYVISPSNYFAHEVYCKHHHSQLFKAKGSFSQLGKHEPPKEVTANTVSEWFHEVLSVHLWMHMVHLIQS